MIRIMLWLYLASKLTAISVFNPTTKTNCASACFPCLLIKYMSNDNIENAKHQSVN